MLHLFNFLLLFRKKTVVTTILVIYNVEKNLNLLIKIKIEK